MSDDLCMSAYYYGFRATGVPEIDLILSAVACAGESFHHTDSWNDEVELPPHEGKTPVDWIQNAGQKAATALEAKDKELAALRAEVERGDFNMMTKLDAAEARAETAERLVKAQRDFMKELSDALISIRPLGGSELFVKRFDEYFADPIFCKAAIKQQRDDYNEAQKERVLANRARETAEQERDQARAALKPFAAQAECWPEIPDNQAMMTSNGEDLSSLDFLMSDLRAARAITEEK